MSTGVLPPGEAKWFDGHCWYRLPIHQQRDEPITEPPQTATPRYDSRSFADQRGGITGEEDDGVAGKKERQRRLAREKYERQQARRVHHARRGRTWTIMGLACVTVVGTGKPAAAAPASTRATPTAAHCTYAAASAPAARKVGVPPATPDGKATYQATIVTNRGDVVIDLLNAKATCTVNSFVYLAGKNYFNKTHCHRLTTSTHYVLQCGDPTGTGHGGPGYQFANENTSGAKYTAGTVAMANVGPGTTGSQFFLVYRDSKSLPPDYTPFGTVVKGLGIIQNVAKAGTDNANGPGDGHPKEKVVIERVTIKKT
jgi:cyclophilin family peptidyl-prolyl cis-trans isomerase